MKRFLISMLLVSFLGFNTIAYASSETSTVQNQVEAGVTPDSFLYSVDKLFEEINLKLASSSEEEAKLLLQYAQERLAETKVMIENNEEDLIKSTVTDYIDTLEAAENKVVETAINSSIGDNIKEDLADNLNTATEISEEIETTLPDQLKEQVTEKTDSVNITAKVVKDIDVDVVKALREKKLGYGQIAHIVALSQASGKSIDEISNMIINKEKGFGEIAKELGLHPSELKSNHNKKDLNTKETVKEDDTLSNEVATPSDTEINPEVNTLAVTKQVNTTETSVLIDPNSNSETVKDFKENNNSEKIKVKELREKEAKDKEKQKEEKNKQYKEVKEKNHENKNKNDKKN